MSKPGYYSLHQVAEITGLSPKTLYWYRATDGGGPPSFKIGRTILYPILEFEQWFDARVAFTLRGSVSPGRPPKLPPRASLVSSIHRSFSPTSELP
jgi:predicted DNA-binding transcriptional regulator AlpA